MIKYLMGILLSISAILSAADGAIQSAYGFKAKGMGGVGIALPQDSVIGALNPAGYALIGNRFDIGLNYLKINGFTQIKGNTLPGGNTHAASRPDVFIPEGGFSYQLSPCWTFGLAAFGRGAKNSFGRNLGTLNGAKKAYAEYSTLFLTPCIAWQPFCNHTFGVGLNLTLGFFKIRGLENLGPSIHPHHVSGKNFDWRPGIGIRLGYLWQMTSCFYFGATYETQTWTHKFKKYEGLIPDKGSANLPSNFGLGLSWKAHPKIVLAFDVMRILWAQTRIWGNRATATHPFGSKQGTGLGWRNQWVYKVGAAWEATPCLTLRVGYNHGTYQLPASQTLANMTIMLVSERQASCGFTYQFGCASEITFAYIHAFRHKIHGKNSIPPQLGSGNADVRYAEDWAILGFGRQF